MFRLAHLSDPHIPPEVSPRRRDLMSKRVLGWTNWRRSRHRIHRQHVLDLLTGDMAHQSPDHVVVTGDLAIVSTPTEWQACRLWLQGLGVPEDISVIPGNHDAYTRRAIPGTALAWREYMSGDPDTAAHSDFPYLRRRGPTAIVGCSSAIVSAPFMATGRVGSAQLRRIGPLLRQLGDEGLFRVVLIHHPPLRSSGDRYRRLTDARAFAGLLSDCGAELVLHGHEHTATVRWTPGPGDSIPVVGVPSASALAHGGRPAAQYNLYELTGGPGSWNCLMRTRGFDGGELIELQDRALYVDGKSSGQVVSGK
ncbi:metallophosphoesterase [Microbaculum marinum]|uniref:Metallophosphoesterase n=1 Tax=Microbaculum marinum TaxID=1764581 RepID=A0AAW9RR36_9HYPH